MRRRPIMTEEEISEFWSKTRMKGLFIPARVADLSSSGRISSTEAMLFGFIDALVDLRGDGCWATNETLGKCVGLTPESTSASIRNLKKHGVLHDCGLKITKYGSYRVLGTYCSGPAVKEGGVGKLTEGGKGIPLEGGKGIPLSTTSLLRKDSEYIEDKRHPPSGFAGESGGSADTIERTEGTMPLFEELERADDKEGKFHRQMAGELRAALVAKKAMTYQWSAKKWAREFRLLCKVVPVHEVQSVLDWYCSRLRDEQTKGLPTGLCNAKHFRQSWNWIKGAYDKWLKRNPDVTVSAEARQIVQTLLMSQWPKGSASQLPAAVQTVLNAFVAFRRKLVKYLDANPTVKTVKGKQTYNQNSAVVGGLYNSLPAATSFAEQWFRQMHSSLVNWKEWSGDIAPFVWSGDPTDEKFSKFVTGLISGYGTPTVNLWLKLAPEFK